jgi:CubicO group peptidase (beta-lactamase class C family)
LLSIGVLRLVQDGAIESLDDPVSKYWPAFVGKDGITIRHALSHQAGLANSMPGGATLDTLLDWKGMKQFLAKHALPEHAPGTQTTYHFLTYCWLCGGIIEGVTGKPYEDYLNGLMEQHQITPSDLHVGGLPDYVENKDLAILSVLREIGMDYSTETVGGVSDSGTEKPEEEIQSSNGEAETVATQSSHSTESSDTQKEETAGAALQQCTVAGKANDKEEEESEREKTYKKVLAKYQGQKHLLNPSIFNMRKVRASKVPSANVHASAASLAAVLDSLNRRRASANHDNDNDQSEANEDLTWFGALLDPHMVDQARQPQPLAPVLSTKTKKGAESLVADASSEIREQQQQQLLSDSTASFGLGFQVHEFTWREQSSSSPQKLLSLGHAGLGGSVVLTIPEIPLTVAFTSNQLDKDGRARNKLLKIVFDEFGLEAPASMR